MPWAGFTVDNPFAFTYEGHHFKKGIQHLNGDEALKYSRMRYDDPNNDYGRQRRGQQVIESAITTFRKQGSLSDANQLMVATADGVRTNLPINNVATLYLNYHTAMTHVAKDHLQGKDAVIDGTDFQIATPAEINRVSNRINTALGRPTTGPIHNHEIALYHSQTSWNGYNHLAFTLPHGAQYNVPGNGY